jgi:hypothetical protein
MRRLLCFIAAENKQGLVDSQYTADVLFGDELACCDTVDPEMVVGATVHDQPLIAD